MEDGTKQTMKRLSWRHSFKGELALLLLILTMLPLLLIGWLIYSKAASNIYESSDIFMGDILEQSTEQFNAHFERWNELAFQLATSQPMKQFLARDHLSDEEAIDTLHSLFPLLNEVDYESEIAEVQIYLIHPEDYPAFLFQSSLFTNRIENNVAITEAIARGGNSIWIGNEKNAGSSKWVRYNLLKHPETGAPMAIMMVSIPDKIIHAATSLPSRWENQRTLVVDNQGMIVTDSMNGKLLSTKIDKQFDKTVRRVPNGSQTIRLNDSSWHATYSSLQIDGWYIIHAIPEADLLEKVKDIRNYWLMLLVVSAAATILVSYYLAGKITFPIQQLVSRMSRVEVGDFEPAPLPKLKRNEIGYLVKGFEDMVQRVKDLVEGIVSSEKKKKELYFEVLSNQINPHLVYNTLDSINWKVRKTDRQDSSEIQELIAQLANFMRLSLNHGDEVTSVGKELEHIKAYLSLEQLRKPLTIDIFYDVPNDLLNIPMLKLVLQPIVENVLQHGKSEEGKCKIMITCRQKGKMLEFSIMDNGPGLPSDLMEAPLDELIQQKKVGVGISNVHERIKIVYGSQYGLTLKNREQNGSKVEIRFPARTP
jgi:sensor histidine kinase YesM